MLLLLQVGIIINFLLVDIVTPTTHLDVDDPRAPADRTTLLIEDLDETLVGLGNLELHLPGEFSHDVPRIAAQEDTLGLWLVCGNRRHLLVVLLGEEGAAHPVLEIYVSLGLRALMVLAGHSQLEEGGDGLLDYLRVILWLDCL